MPMLTELRSRFLNTANSQTCIVDDGETLVSDSRNGLRPTQILNDKLTHALLREQKSRQAWLPTTMNQLRIRS
jgi:hypothetical protein